jgi:putative two-component system response regulator
MEGKGSHFDPDIVDAFVAIQDEFQAIAARFVDTDNDLEKKAESLALLQRVNGVAGS